MKRKESYSQQAEKDLPRQNDELAAAHIDAEIEHRRYRDLFNFAPDGYLVTDGGGIIREANQTAAVMLGVSRELLPGKPMAVYIGEKDRKGLLDRLRQPKQYADQKGWEIILVPQHASPFPVTVNFVPIFDPLEKITGLCWLIHDISVRKQVENALRASEAKWRSLVKNAPVIVTVVDRAGYIQFINRVSFHPAVEDLMVTLVDNYLPPAEQERFHSNLTRVFESRISEKYESANTRPDGSLRWIEHVCTPVFDGEGRYLGRRGSNRDATERKLAEEILYLILESNNRSQRPLMALNQAGQTIQRARTPQEVFRRIGEELARLVYHTCIFTLTEDQKNLVLTSVTFPSDELKEIFLQTGL